MPAEESGSGVRGCRGARKGREVQWSSFYQLSVATPVPLAIRGSGWQTDLWLCISLYAMTFILD